MLSYLRSLVAPIGVHREMRAYGWSTIVAPLVAFLVGVAFVQGFVRDSTFEMFARATHGRVQLQLVLPIVLVVPVALAYRMFRVRRQDTGLFRGTVLRAAAQLVAIIAIAQAVLVLDNLAVGDGITIASSSSLQALVYQFFGIALVEELVFRGWLIPQLYQRLRVRRGETASLVLAVVIVSLIFTLCHLPVLLRDASSSDSLLPQLAHIELLALAFSFMYVRTGDLAIGVAFHVVSNEPIALLHSALPAAEVYACLFWLRLLAQPWFERSLSTDDR